jgi:hypothetical protein
VDPNGVIILVYMLHKPGSDWTLIFLNPKPKQARMRIMALALAVVTIDGDKKYPKIGSGSQHAMEHISLTSQGRPPRGENESHTRVGTQHRAGASGFEECKERVRLEILRNVWDRHDSPTILSRHHRMSTEI